MRVGAQQQACRCTSTVLKGQHPATIAQPDTLASALAHPSVACAGEARTLPQQTRSAGAQPSAAARPAQKGPPPRTCASRTGALRGPPAAWPPALQGPAPCGQAQRDPEPQNHATIGTASSALCARQDRRSTAPGRTRRRLVAAWRRTRGRRPAPRSRPARRRQMARPRRRRAADRARAGAWPAGRPRSRPPHRRLLASQGALSDRQADRAGSGRRHPPDHIPYGAQDT